MKRKLPLTELKVSSFVTLSEETQENLKGNGFKTVFGCGSLFTHQIVDSVCQICFMTNLCAIRKALV